MQTLIFYTTDDCHLCEEAAALLKKLSSLRQINIEPIDISASESLIHLYGIRIPVVKNMAVSYTHLTLPTIYSG